MRCLASMRLVFSGCNIANAKKKLVHNSMLFALDFGNRWMVFCQQIIIHSIFRWRKGKKRIIFMLIIVWRFIPFCQLLVGNEWNREEKRERGEKWSSLWTWFGYRIDLYFASAQHTISTTRLEIYMKYHKQMQPNSLNAAYAWHSNDQLQEWELMEMIWYAFV